MSRLSPGAVQMMLPFMSKLAASPKSEQPFQQLMAMSRAVEPQTAAVSPWQRLMEAVPKSGHRSPEGLLLHPERMHQGVPESLAFEFKPPNQPVSIGGQVLRGAKPDEAYLSYMGSNATSRVSAGAINTNNKDYVMDISSPAQRDLPLRGMRLTEEQRAARVLRKPEERIPLEEREVRGPQPTMAQKQAAADRFLSLLRGAGFKNLAFSAEAGERPELYSRITGLKAKPEGETTMHGLLNRLPGPRAVLARSQAMSPLEHVISTNRMSPQMAENILGLSVDEALEYGLAQRAGTDFKLTSAGQAAARDWIAQRGQL